MSGDPITLLNGPVALVGSRPKGNLSSTGNIASVSAEFLTPNLMGGLSAYESNSDLMFNSSQSKINSTLFTGFGGIKTNRNDIYAYTSIYGGYQHNNNNLNYSSGLPTTAQAAIGLNVGGVVSSSNAAFGIQAGGHTPLGKGAEESEPFQTYIHGNICAGVNKKLGENTNVKFSAGGEGTYFPNSAAKKNYNLRGYIAPSIQAGKFNAGVKLGVGKEPNEQGQVFGNVNATITF